MKTIIRMDATIPHNAVIHEGNDTEPEITWGRLYELLRIATKPHVNEVCYQGPRHCFSIKEDPSFEPPLIVRLSLNELIDKAMPVFNHIDDLHKRADQYRRERDDAVNLNVALQASNRNLRADLERINEIINPE